MPLRLSSLPRLPGAEAFPALRHRNFRLFITGQFISLCGWWMQNVALGWLVLELTDSAFAVGVVGAAGTLPVLLFTLQGGALASRVDRLRTVTILQALMLLVALALALLAMSDHVTLGWIVAIALATGLLAAFEIPARQALTLDLVGRDDLLNAVALNSMSFNVSRVIGPALGGILIAVAGPAICFFLNAASYLAVLAGLLRVRLDPALVVKHRTRPSIRDGLRYVLQPGWPRVLVTLTTTYTIFAVSFLTVLPVYARDVIGTGAAGYGWLSSAFGVGAALGALLLAAQGRRMGRGEVAVQAGLLIGAALMVLGALPIFGLAFLMLVAAGLAVAANAVTTNTLLQTESPDDLRGHVIGLYAFVVVGLAPIGALQAGWVAEHLGVRAEVAIGGLACLTMTLVMRRQAPLTEGAVRQPRTGLRRLYPWKDRRRT